MLAREWTRETRQAEDAVGTHVPFTTPLLSGVCVRANRHALDFMLPNPAGGRGTYVIGWKSVVGYAAPTLHDVMLAGRLSELQLLTPATVRGAAQAIALDGYAGQQAADAAQRGRGRIDSARQQLWSDMLTALMAASALAEEERTQWLAGLGRAGPGVMTPGLNALAKRLGWEPATLFDALGRLSASYAPLCQGGRIPALLVLLERVQTELPRALAAMQTDPAQASTLPPSLRRLGPDLDHCLRHGRAIVDAAVRTLQQPVPLLESWRVDSVIPIQAMDLVERSLDGWDRIALLWESCGSISAWLAALPEIALLLRLAAERTRVDAASTADRPEIRMATPPERPSAETGLHANQPGAGPSAAMLVERNERIRALEIELESGNG